MGHSPGLYSHPQACVRTCLRLPGLQLFVWGGALLQELQKCIRRSSPSQTRPRKLDAEPRPQGYEIETSQRGWQFERTSLQVVKGNCNKKLSPALETQCERKRMLMTAAFPSTWGRSPHRGLFKTLEMVCSAMGKNARKERMWSERKRAEGSWEAGIHRLPRVRHQRCRMRKT